MNVERSDISRGSAAEERIERFIGIAGALSANFLLGFKELSPDRLDDYLVGADPAIRRGGLNAGCDLVGKLNA